MPRPPFMSTSAMRGTPCPGGSTYIQRGLLEMIALAREPSSVPFWSALLDLRRPRDCFAAARRDRALAALALLSITKDTPEAWNGLSAAAQHVDPEARALAVYYIGCACQEGEGPLPVELREKIADIARRDDSFGARFQARRALLAAGESVPLDNPGGVYLFKIGGTQRGDFSRTIAARSEQTLDHLHSAIQHALDWDDDHLYSFYMNGKCGDQRYAFASPREGNPPFTDEAVIGSLGMRPKHKFLYLFDYGDWHEFIIELVGVVEKAEKGRRYPRVIERHGAAPEQYPSWDDEE